MWVWYIKKLKKNKSQHLERRPHQFSSLYTGRIGHVGFCGGKKTAENPEKKPFEY